MGKPALNSKGERARAIAEYVQASRVPVTLREISDVVGASPTNIWHHVKKLEAIGVLRRIGSRGVVANRPPLRSPEALRLSVATRLCKEVLEQLGDAKSIQQALLVHDGLERLYRVLKEEL